MELDLVVLPFITNPSPHEVQEFTGAAGAGDFDEARAFNRAQLRTPHSELSVTRGGLDVQTFQFPATFPDFRLSPC